MGLVASQDKKKTNEHLGIVQVLDGRPLGVTYRMDFFRIKRSPLKSLWDKME